MVAGARRCMQPADVGRSACTANSAAAAAAVGACHAFCTHPSFTAVCVSCLPVQVHGVMNLFSTKKVKSH